jgi:hypothetical protein
MNPEFEEQPGAEREPHGWAPGGDHLPAGEAGLRGIDEVLEIESLLRRMPLRRPGAALDGRVLSACRRPIVRRRLWWAAAAALVAAAGAGPIVGHLLTQRERPGDTSQTTRHLAPAGGEGAAQNPVRPEPAPPPARAQPVRIERTLAGGFNSDGVVGVADHAPLHRYRRLSVRQMWIIDLKTGKRMAVTIPREEVVLVRVEPF